MFRKHNAKLDQVRSIDMHEVAGLVGLEPARRERHKFSCPGCNSSDALHIYPGAEQGAYCFSCQRSFDQVALVMATLGLSFVDALAWFGGGEVPVAPRRGLRSARDDDAGALFAVRRQVMSEIWRILEPAPLTTAAARWLTSRAIAPRTACQLGCRDWSIAYDGIVAILQQLSPRELQGVGLASRSGRPFFWPAISQVPVALAIPADWFPGEAAPLSWRFRPFACGNGPKSLSQPRCASLNNGTDRPLRGVLGLSVAHGSAGIEGHVVVVVEGEMDWLSVHQVMGGQVACLGLTHGRWPNQITAALDMAQRVLVMLHDEQGGRRAANQLRESMCSRYGESKAVAALTVQLLAPDQDANDLICRDPELLKQRLVRALQGGGSKRTEENS